MIVMQSPRRQHICMLCAPGGCEIVSSLIFTLLNWGISQAYILHRDVKPLQITSLRWSSGLTRVIGGSKSSKLARKTWDLHEAKRACFGAWDLVRRLPVMFLKPTQENERWSVAVRLIRMFWTSASHQRQRPLSEESVIRVGKLHKWHIPSWKLLILTQIWATLHSMCPPVTLLLPPQGMGAKHEYTCADIHQSGLETLIHT